MLRAFILSACGDFLRRRVLSVKPNVFFVFKSNTMLGISHGLRVFDFARSVFR